MFMMQRFLDGSIAVRDTEASLWEVTKGDDESAAAEFVRVQNKHLRFAIQVMKVAA